MVSFEQGIPMKKVKKHIPWSATLIATFLLALSPKEHVMAQEKEDTDSGIEINSLYAKYHSLLNERNQADAEKDQVDIEVESSSEISAEEVKAIQGQLILFIESHGDTALAEEMKVEVFTLGELEDLFADLLKSPVLEDASEEFIQSEELVEATNKEELIETEEIHIDEELADLKLNEVNNAQPATLSAEISTEKLVSYTVRAGDTLNKIARAHKVTVNQLAKLNNINNVNSIRVGQVLTIQGSKIENQPANDLANLGKPMSNNEFIEFLGGHAAIAAKEQNLYASVMIAQAALESGFGTSGLSSSPNHNLYGMKGRYEGDSVVMRTREYSTAKGWHHVNAHFKKYPSYLESLLDHSAYIRRGTSWAPEYYSGVWRENTTSYRDATSWLQGRYATDPTYANKLNQIIERYNLTSFDIIGEDDVIIQPPINNTRPEQSVKPSTGDKEADSAPESTSDSTQTSVYQVKRGDTLSRIALVHKMSVPELKELNSLRSDLILVGQRLKVKQTEAMVKPTPAPSRPVESTNPTNYTVKRGDTLSQIARLYKMSVRELKELNNLPSDLIYVGQALKVKEIVVESTLAPMLTPTPTTANKTSYVVKRGDTLSRIAPLYKMSVRELKELNNLPSDLIYIGQQLKIHFIEKVSNPVKVKNYQIKAGDTLSFIAREFNTTVKSLKEKNNLQSDLIYVNQKIKI